MTTIILTIIGILLAAAAALMVIFYGGDAFSSGTVGAQANQYQNAGTNVVSAAQMWRAETGALPTSLTALTGPAPNGAAGAFLDELPALPVGATVPAFAVANAGTPVRPIGVYTVQTVPLDVCTRINSNLRNGTVAGAADAAAAITASRTRPQKMGCIPIPVTSPTNGLFYARV